MATGFLGIPSKDIVSAEKKKKNDRVTAILMALLDRCLEYRNLCIIE